MSYLTSFMAGIWVGNEQSVSKENGKNTPDFECNKRSDCDMKGIPPWKEEVMCCIWDEQARIRKNNLLVGKEQSYFSTPTLYSRIVKQK